MDIKEFENICEKALLESDTVLKEGSFVYDESWSAYGIINKIDKDNHVLVDLYRNKDGSKFHTWDKRSQVDSNLAYLKDGSAAIRNEIDRLQRLIQRKQNIEKEIIELTQKY